MRVNYSGLFMNNTIPSNKLVFANAFRQMAIQSILFSQFLFSHSTIIMINPRIDAKSIAQT